jgi:hypothetical protein
MLPSVPTQSPSGRLTPKVCIVFGLLSGVGLALWLASPAQPTQSEEAFLQHSKLVAERTAELKLVETGLREAETLVAGHDPQVQEQLRVAAHAHHDRTTTDPEWESLPRTQFDPAQQLANTPESIAARDLFRNRHLNPTDNYIPKQARDLFASWFESRRTGVATMRNRVHDTTTHEINALIDLGRARGMTAEDYYSRLSGPEQIALTSRKHEHKERLIQEGRSEAEAEALVNRTFYVSTSKMFPFRHYATANRGSMFYAASLQELPSTRQLLDVYRYLIGEMVQTVTDNFVAWEALAPDQAIKIVQQTVARVDKLHRQ